MPLRKISGQCHCVTTPSVHCHSTRGRNPMGHRSCTRHGRPTRAAFDHRGKRATRTCTGHSTFAPELGAPLPQLHRHWARCRISTGTGLLPPHATAPATACVKPNRPRCRAVGCHEPNHARTHARTHTHTHTHTHKTAHAHSTCERSAHCESGEAANQRFGALSAPHSARESATEER